MIRRSCQCLGGWHLTIYRTAKRIDAEEKSAGGIIIPGIFVLACNIGGSDWKITLRFIRAIGYAATAFTSDALFGAWRRQRIRGGQVMPPGRPDISGPASVTTAISLPVHSAERGVVP
jgi:hypothetical protein